MAEPTRDEVEDFIRNNDVDERAAADLRSCSGEIQRKVLSRGELSTARNPSAAVLARIRDARSSAAIPTGSTSTEVEDFIKGNDVDESAADMLRSASPTVQRSVISRGELKTARNPSSALLSRIRDAKQDRIASGGGDRGALTAATSMSSMAAMTPAIGYGSYGLGMYPGYPGYPGYAGYGTFPAATQQAADSRGYAAGIPAATAAAYSAYPGGYNAYAQAYAAYYGMGASQAAYGAALCDAGASQAAYGAALGAQGMPGMMPQAMPVMDMTAAVPNNGATTGGTRGRSRSSSASRSRSRDRRRRRGN